MTEREAELLQRIAVGDADAAIVLADLWRDEHGEVPEGWLGEPRLVDDAIDHRISPRYYRRGQHIGAAHDMCEATAVGPRGELGRFVVKFPSDGPPYGGDEAALVARFDHPHLVRSAGPVVSGEFGRGFAMPWAGESVDTLPFEDHDLARLVGIQVCEALRELARLGISHDVIAPENLMLVDDHVTLGGFGIAATPFDPHPTRTWGLPQNMEYYPPERYLDQPRGTASDLFSLAGTLLEIATGVHPFERESGTQSMIAIAYEPIAITGDSPIERLARRTLVLDPAQRPTLDEFQAALR